VKHNRKGGFERRGELREVRGRGGKGFDSWGVRRGN